MSKKGNSDFFDQDDFWNLDMMIPKHPYGKRLFPDTDPVEVRLKNDKKSELPQEKIPKREAAEKGSSKAPSPKSENNKPSDFDLRLKAAKEALKCAQGKVGLDVDGNTINYDMESIKIVGSDSSVRYDNWFTPSDFDSIKVGIQAKKKEAEEAEDTNSELDLDFDFGFGLNYEKTKRNAGYSELITEYRPQSPLIYDVRVKSWDQKYMFYERFRASAVEYFDLDGRECDFQPFFSYLPQYIHLSGEQFSYYIWWRNNIRRGKHIRTSYSYILLYVFEIINLPDLIPPKEGQNLIIDVWTAYRGEFPRLDKELCEWLCDYCLVNSVMPEPGCFSDFLPDILRYCSFTEFYLGLDKSEGSPLVNAIFLNCSTYNYRQSKFINDKNRHLFDKHIKRAFCYAFSKLEESGALNGKVPSIFEDEILISRKTKRTAYDSAVCAYDIKREIEIEYLTVSRSTELRFAATDTVKYAENQIRSLLGIKSKFHVPELRIQLREAVDEYFKPYKERAKQKKAAHEAERPADVFPDYEKDYDAKNTGFSAEYSLRLEEEAWAATDMLVSDEETDSSGAFLKGQSKKSGNEQNAGNKTGAAGQVQEQPAEQKSAQDNASLYAGQPADPNASGGESSACENHTDNKDSTDEVVGSGSAGGSIDGSSDKSITSENRTDSKGCTNNMGSADEVDGSGSAGGSGTAGGSADGGERSIVVTALSYLLDRDSAGFNRLANEHNLLPDALAETVNDTLYDVIGDIAIEDKENGYEIVPDYKSELEDFING